MHLRDSYTHPYPYLYQYIYRFASCLKSSFPLATGLNLLPPPSLPPPKITLCMRQTLQTRHPFSSRYHTDPTSFVQVDTCATRLFEKCPYLRMDDSLESRGLQPLSENWVLFYSRMRPNCHTHRIWDLMAVSSHELSIIKTIWLRRRLTLLAIF